MAFKKIVVYGQQKNLLSGGKLLKNVIQGVCFKIPPFQFLTFDFLVCEITWNFMWIQVNLVHFISKRFPKFGKITPNELKIMKVFARQLFFTLFSDTVNWQLLFFIQNSFVQIGTHTPKFWLSLRKLILRTILYKF